MSKTEEAAPALTALLTIAVRSSIEQAAHEATEEACKQLRRRIAEVVAGATLEVSRMIEVETYRDRIVLTVRLEG